MHECEASKNYFSISSCDGPFINCAVCHAPLSFPLWSFGSSFTGGFAAFVPVMSRWKTWSGLSSSCVVALNCVCVCVKHLKPFVYTAEGSAARMNETGGDGVGCVCGLCVQASNSGSSTQQQH